MSPVKLKGRRVAARHTEQVISDLIEIFNNSQHVASSDLALSQLKNLYATTDFDDLEKPFMACLKRLLQSEQTVYFKNSCDFICKFLFYVTNTLNDDRLVRSCADVADHYMQVENEDCRLGAVFFTTKLLLHIEVLDEEICHAFKVTLAKRIRDKKAAIRAQAILASRKFQDDKLIQEGFLFHFNHDPEFTVRRALLLTMDVKVFGLDFLADSTQDSHETIRKTAFFRLSKVSPSDLESDQFHKIMHNGLFERERQASFSFKTNTLEPWLTQMYDGHDLVKLIGYFDVVGHLEDVNKLLNLVHERDLDKIENNGTTTKLHHVVESFRERWLNSNDKCLPNLDCLNERVITVWLSLVSFCKKNSSIVKPVRVLTIQPVTGNPVESLEQILDAQERNNEEIAELYERLTPDLVNLVDFLKRFVRHTYQQLKADKSLVGKCEYTYQRLMEFIMRYDVGDELERRTVQEALGSVLRENLLTGYFNGFIPPIVKSLHKLVYYKKSNLTINYISELIQNIRSHLEDIAMSSLPSHDEKKDDPNIFKHHTNELIKCLQMYNACLECVKITEVPPIMCNHLSHLSYESLDECFQDNTRVRTLMIACNGLTALMDKSFAQLDRTITLLISACYDSANCLGIKTVGFKSLVDVIIEHEVPELSARLDKFLHSALRDYGRYDPKNIKNDELEFITAVVEGTARLFYYKKLNSPELLSHIMIWWCHPRTHSKLIQFIGVFLPMFVRHLSAQRTSADDHWLEDLLSETFVTSIEYLHNYIVKAGFNIMDECDMNNLISFLCNLVPISFHPRVHEFVDRRIDDLSNRHRDLTKFLKQSKNNLTDAKANSFIRSASTKPAGDYQDPLVIP